MNELLARVRSEGRLALTEVEAYALCREYGVSCPDFRFVGDVSEIDSAANELGFPIAVKIVSPDILHKTEAGGVIVGVDDLGSARDAFSEVIANARKKGARISGVLMQKMAPHGLEVMIGSAHDPAFGATLMFGLGGVFAEVLKDVTFRLTPIEKIDAEEMLAEIKASQVLDGYRGGQPVKKEALVDMMLAVSRLVTEITDLDQIDLNPVIADGDGAITVDARVILKSLV